MNPTAASTPNAQRERPSARQQAGTSSSASDQQELLWAVLENLNEGVVACDAHGTLTFFNRATREFHGMTEEPIGVEEWSQRYSLHRADGTPMNAEEVPLARALGGEIVNDTVMVIAPRDRDARTVICTGKPLHDSSGRLLGAVVIMRDITDQLAAERQTADLIRERELNVAKDEFLATVAHELRNPLTTIVAWTQMLQLREEESRRALTAIEESARMQAQLIADLSDIGRITSGKFHLNRERLLVGEILESALAGARPSAEVKGISITAPASYEQATVEADRVRLQQVFWNLIANALKFTPPGGAVFVDVHAETDHVRVEVRDTGRGIGAEFLPRVFDRYSQEGGKRDASGLGLGLSIARTIVELHGGSIAAASDGEGTGATFTVILPVLNSPGQFTRARS